MHRFSLCEDSSTHLHWNRHSHDAPFLIMHVWLRPSTRSPRRPRFRPKSYIRQLESPVRIAVSILCTSCKTKFWVIDQNRKHFPEVADTAFLRSRPKTTPTLVPGQTSSTAKSEVDSRLLARQLRSRLPTSRHCRHRRPTLVASYRLTPEPDSQPYFYTTGSRTLTFCGTGPTPHHG